MANITVSKCLPHLSGCSPFYFQTKEPPLSTITSSQSHSPWLGDIVDSRLHRLAGPVRQPFATVDFIPPQPRTMNLATEMDDFCYFHWKLSFICNNVINLQTSLNFWEQLYILKGVWHEIFDLSFFSWISVPQAPKYSIGAVLNFFENSGRYSQINVYHRCQRHRRKAVQRCQRHRRLVLVTDFQWSPVSLIPGINLSLTPVTNYQRWQRHRR